MMYAVPKLSNYFIHYASHRLRANFHFSAIETIMQLIKTDLSIAYMVPDHKHRVLQIIYCEGQVDYFGKKVISLLGVMWVRWKVDGKISGF